MVANCDQNLNELKVLIGNLTDDQYQKPSLHLSGATIGQHVRHILEFYSCLLNGLPEEHVNYDQRIRDLFMEQDRNYVSFVLDEICEQMKLLRNETTLTLGGNFGLEGGCDIKVSSSVGRELIYCYEHSIHHMAMIKIAVIEQNLGEILNDNFGVAPSTVRKNKLECAQ